MTWLYVLAAVGGLTVLVLLGELFALIEDALVRLARRWRLYRHVLAEDLAALRTWARMARTHWRAVRRLARELDARDRDERS